MSNYQHPRSHKNDEGQACGRGRRYQVSEESANGDIRRRQQVRPAVIQGLFHGRMSTTRTLCGRLMWTANCR